MKRFSLLRNATDPFLLHAAMPYRQTFHVLGVPVYFESNRRWFLRIAEWAYDYLPATTPARTAEINIRLFANGDAINTEIQPPAGPFYYGADQITTVVFTPADMLTCALQSGSGFITVSPAMAQLTHTVRTEMIEFATYRLVQAHLNAVGMHAACIASGDRSRLIFGPTGAGKSSVVLAALMQGWELVCEDAAFVLPGPCPTLCGVPAFIHLLENALPYFPDIRLSDAAVRPIMRRSGRTKLEIDIRKLARSAMRVEAPLDSMIFISARRRAFPRIRQIDAAQAGRLLNRQQPFARQNTNWKAVEAALLALPAYELELGDDPHDGARLAGALK